MLTFFTTAKAFEGHSGIIQSNALQSWKRLDPGVEVILFGDDLGAAEISTEFGLRHEAHVQRHPSGMKYLNYMFARAQNIARHGCLCYSNCDIILMADFWKAFQRERVRREPFLMIGRRWDTDITEPIDFRDKGWQAKVRQAALAANVLQATHFIDFFVFRKGLYDEIPPMVVGRSYWDHWLVWKALERGAEVVDATPFMMAVHQNHGYGYHPQGKRGTNEDELALRNIALAGGRQHLRTLIHSTHRITRKGAIRVTPFRKLFENDTVLGWRQTAVEKTFAIRDRLGLRRQHLARFWSNVTRRVSFERTLPNRTPE
jgi:hypothetical protein